MRRMISRRKSIVANSIAIATSVIRIIRDINARIIIIISVTITCHINRATTVCRNNRHRCYVITINRNNNYANRENRITTAMGQPLPRQQLLYQ